MRLVYCKECDRIYFDYTIARIYEDVVNVGLDSDSMEGALIDKEVSKDKTLTIVSRLDEAEESTEYARCPLFGSHHNAQFVNLNFEECKKKFLKRIITDDDQLSYRHIQLKELSSEDLVTLKSILDM